MDTAEVDVEVDEEDEEMNRALARCRGCDSVFVVGRCNDGRLFPLGRDSCGCEEPDLHPLE